VLFVAPLSVWVSVIDIWGIKIYLEIGFWNLGFCPSLPWAKFHDIAQHVILTFQDA